VSRWLLALVVSVASLPGAHAREAVQVIDECLAKLDPGADIGYARVVARCPDLPGGLSQSPVAAWLPTDWNRPDNQLSAAGLAELRVLLTQPPIRAQRRAPRVDTVAALLATFVQSERTNSSWWDRFRQWLRGILATQPAPDESWLQRLLVKVFTSNAADTIVWTSLALVVALALGIIFNELRLAGLIGRGERGGRRRQAERSPTAAAAGLEQIARATPAEQARMLLEFIARRLAEQQRLPPARALTTRELTQRARLPEAERASLAELASVCERVRFSGREVPGASLAEAIVRGKSLLAALDLRPSAAAQAA
jgi:hypothetical protein